MTFVLYANYRYAWDERLVGLSLATLGICSAVVGAGLVRPAVERWGEARTLVIGLFFGTVGYLIYGLAPTGFWFWIGIPVQCLWGLYGPPMQSLMSRRVDSSAQGRLQGALSSLRGIGFMLGPGLFTLAFAAAIGPYQDLGVPGAPFLLAALVLAAAMVVAWRATRAGA